MRIEEQKSGALNQEDRLEIARLLIKAGYTVAVRSEKRANTSRVNHYVEFHAAENVTFREGA